MDIISLILGGGAVAAVAVPLFKKLKGAYKLGIVLEHLKFLGFGTGFVKFAVSFRLLNNSDAQIDITSYMIRIKYQETTIVTAVEETEIKIAPRASTVAQFNLQSANIPLTLINALIDIYNNGLKTDFTVEYSIKAKGLPEYSDVETYTL